MGFLSGSKKVGKGLVYSVTGDWSGHGERIKTILALKRSKKERLQALKDDIAQNPATDSADAFYKMCVRCDYSESDIEHNTRSYRISLTVGVVILIILFSIFVSMLFWSDINLLGIIAFSFSLIFWSIRVLTWWFRLSQLTDRNLYSFKNWILGQAE